MIHLTLAELVHIVERATSGRVTIRDAGLLEAAAARPQATAFGVDAYSDLHAKAAALVHSPARNHALVDGNKRLALGALVAFYGINGRRLTFTIDAAFELIPQVAAGELDSVDEIAAILEDRPHPAMRQAPAKIVPRATAFSSFARRRRAGSPVCTALGRLCLLSSRSRVRVALGALTFRETQPRRHVFPPAQSLD